MACRNSNRVGCNILYWGSLFNNLKSMTTLKEVFNFTFLLMLVYQYFYVWHGGRVYKCYLCVLDEGGRIHMFFPCQLVIRSLMGHVWWVLGDWWGNMRCSLSCPWVIGLLLGCISSQMQKYVKIWFLIKSTSSNSPL